MAEIESCKIGRRAHVIMTDSIKVLQGEMQKVGFACNQYASHNEIMLLCGSIKMSEYCSLT
jgi:hypothetical protein